MSAWSVQALAEESARQGRAPLDIKSSYADSPFCGYGERHLEPVRPNPSEALTDWPAEAAPLEVG
ncbi:hypothetical protein [Streptomyces sp. NPDC058812]|uniref:hypothetical protein n=1 Tax=unclassified Streptomyces TaxID=2593676 RepID=UPI0036A646EA